MSTRLVRSSSGRPLWAVVTVPSACSPSGMRFRVLGNSIEAAGVSVGFLGEATGRSATETEQADRRRVAARHGQPRSWPDEYPERARELHVQGLTYHEVAERLGVPFGTVKSWLRTQPVDDERLDDEEAIRLARIEQQREPADLIGHAA